MSAAGDLPPAPSDSSAWPTERVYDFWARVGRERMAARLATGGRTPGVFETHVAALEESLLAVASGGHLAVAFEGARWGFVQAALDYWTDIAAEAGQNIDLASDAGAHARFDLEREVSRWTTVPGLAATLVDAVTEAIVRGYLSQPTPIRTSIATPRHARYDHRRSA